MSTESKNGSDIDPENVIAVTLDDLSEDVRRELEEELEKEKVERLKLKLAGYAKTRNGVVKKVVPSPSDAQVKNSTEEIAHLIDVSVASKYGSDMENTTRTITQAVANRLEEFKEQFNKDLEKCLPGHVRSLVLQVNDEYSGKRPMPPDSSRFNNFPSNIHTPSASANAMQPHVPLNNNLDGRNYVGSSANNFVPSTTAPIVSTSVPENHNSNN